jgi:hypothetical protein
VIERAKAEELSDEQLDRELQKRLRELLYRDQRQSFEKYCENGELFPEESPAKHHAFMCAALQLVEQGEIKRLMVLMPPGHGKSVYCSVRFPSWYLGKRPGRGHSPLSLSIESPVRSLTSLLSGVLAARSSTMHVR